MQQYLPFINIRAGKTKLLGVGRMKSVLLSKKKQLLVIILVITLVISRNL
jgi:hypothetical protein